MSEEKAILEHLERLAAALDRLAPPPPARADFAAAEAFVWQATPEAFLPVAHVNRQPLGLLKGIDRAAEQLLENTRRFARGLPANNALLWGARGMGKSSLVKAAHAEVRQGWGSRQGQPDLSSSRSTARTSPRCPPAAHLRAADGRFIVFCDDLSFDKDDTPTSRSRPCWKAASKAGRRTSCSMPPPTAAT
jgi:predicted AAA+ superfamily ATPase